MRILILANNDVGLYKFRKELIEQLLVDHEIYISLPPGDFIDPLVKLGCKYIETQFDRRGMNPISDLKLLAAYIRMIKKCNPGVVLSYTIKPNIYGGIAAQLTRTPYIANITGLGTAVENDGLVQKITLFLCRIAFAKVRCLFIQNMENMQFFEKHRIAEGKRKLIPGSGVNLEYYQVLEYPPDDTVEFAFISRIMKEKGIDQYLEAAEYIRGKYPNTRFHVCGFCEEEYEGKLQEYDQKGIIEYHGMVRDVREILGIAHCTVHPSYYPEGKSNVLLESAACGRPIITTDRSGCRECIDVDVSGFCIAKQNAKSLIDAIERFLHLSYDQKEMMGICGRRKMEREFDRQIVVTAYANETERIVEKQ